MVHYQSQVEKEVEDLFKEVKGLCKECNDSRPMEFADFARHFALDHDRIYNVVSADIKRHLSVAFPGSDAIISKPDDEDEDMKENHSIANDTFEENIQIEIESVEDKELEESLEKSKTPTPTLENSEVLSN